MNLKLLEDIPEELYAQDFVEKEVLKQEAIKWIDELRCPRVNTKTKLDDFFEFMNIKSMSEKEAVLIAGWIRFFFNITSENLK